MSASASAQPVALPEAWRAALAATPEGDTQAALLARGEPLSAWLTRLGEPGDRRLVAARVLPFVDGGELALQPLSDLLAVWPAAGPWREGDRLALLDTLCTLLERGPARGEALDPDGAARAIDLVEALARAASSPPDERARAESAVRALVRRGAIREPAP